MAHSEESRLANLLRRVSREDDRERRLATLKQLKEFISHGESKVVSQMFPVCLGALSFYFYNTRVLVKSSNHHAETRTGGGAVFTVQIQRSGGPGNNEKPGFSQPKQ